MRTKPVVSKVTSKSQTVIPAVIREKLGIGPGDSLRYVETADGIMIEVHPNPAVALSDQKQQVDFEQFDDYLEEVGYHHQLTAKRLEVAGFGVR